VRIDYSTRSKRPAAAEPNEPSERKFFARLGSRSARRLAARLFTRNCRVHWTPPREIVAGTLEQIESGAITGDYRTVYDTIHADPDGASLYACRIAGRVLRLERSKWA